ncbi:MAG: YceI family protein [Zetaproteobacteria bacterium]|nr:YceI family protein [Zetaproteobacteria bacterium]
MRLIFFSQIVFLSCFLFSSVSSARCRFQFDDTSAGVTWTGYKFSEKVGVSGTFDVVTFSQNSKSASVASLVKSVHFRVDSASINSGMPARDKKLALYLFGSMLDPGAITGKVKSYRPKLKVATASILMNGVSQDVAFAVADNGNQLLFTGEIDLLSFKMKKGFERIAKACQELHTGPDGKAKTWSVVGLKVVAPYAKTCQ